MIIKHLEVVNDLLIVPILIYLICVSPASIYPIRYLASQGSVQGTAWRHWVCSGLGNTSNIYSVGIRNDIAISAEVTTPRIPMTTYAITGNYTFYLGEIGSGSLSSYGEGLSCGGTSVCIFNGNGVSVCG